MTRLPQLSPPASLRDAPAAGEEQWFDDGVRFRCLGPECGDCCSGKHGPGAVWVGGEEIRRLASHLALTVRDLRRRCLRRLAGRTSLRERANFDCVFYRPGEGCSVYEARPLQCRTYPFWGRILASRVTWEIEAEACPGIDYDHTRVAGEDVKRLLTIDARRYRPRPSDPVTTTNPEYPRLMNSGTLHRIAAFTTTPDGGNPAGVWVGDALPEPGAMQRIAAEVGFSETAFVAPATGPDRVVRYYSPEAEVSFCGHATIATGVVLGEAGGDGTYRLATTVGEVPVAVSTRDGIRQAALTSVEPKHEPVAGGLLGDALAALGWRHDDLDPTLPPARAYAGAWHLVLAAGQASRLADLDYDFETLKALMLAHGLTTLQLVWRESDDVLHSRNPFPVGGVVEDPATGAAAAALGGYLRAAELVTAPATIVIRQGEAMGRPSRLVVEIPARGGIVVSGAAVRL